MTPTSIPRETLVACDMAELTMVPVCDNDDYELIVIKGQSASQVNFATSVRARKLEEWEPDLDDSIYKALHGVNDAGFWLANKDADTASIRWPSSWVGQSAAGAGLSSGRAYRRPSEMLFEEAERKTTRPQDLAQFEAFARKACRSPELAYLAMMALMYRQTKDLTVLAKFSEARSTIQGHLDAIDEILGSPGE